MVFTEKIAALIIALLILLSTQGTVLGDNNIDNIDLGTNARALPPSGETDRSDPLSLSLLVPGNASYGAGSAVSGAIGSLATDVTFTYDANGNLINGKGLAYVYDDANHLSEVRFASNNTLISKYSYDDAGNRVKKVSGGVTTYYIGNLVETRIQGAQRKDTSYYFANNERAARKDSDGSKYYYHGDQLGSTSIVTNSSGSVVESVAYLPYGETQSKTGSGSSYLYTDQELDSETGLYYYGARYYSPEMMRFVEPDPVIQNIYNPQNLNRYSYVLNNPINMFDPQGSSSMFGEGLRLEISGAVTALVGVKTLNPCAIYTGATKFFGGLVMEIEWTYRSTVDIYDLGMVILNQPGASFKDHQAKANAKAEAMAENIENMANPFYSLGYSNEEYDLALTLSGGVPKKFDPLEAADISLGIVDYGGNLWDYYSSSNNKPSPSSPDYSSSSSSVWSIDRANSGGGADISTYLREINTPSGSSSPQGGAGGRSGENGNQRKKLVISPNPDGKYPWSEARSSNPKRHVGHM